MNPVKGSKEYFQSVTVDHSKECMCIICAPRKEPRKYCPDCIAAAKHAYSDATTPCFFYDMCEWHRKQTPDAAKATHAG